MLTSNKEASEEDSLKSQPEDEESGAAAPAAVYANDGSLKKKLKMENTLVVETGVTTTTFVSRVLQQSVKIESDRHSQPPESKQGLQGRD
jgi:hypothetical protein